jgi:hypothetical protein
MMCVIHSCPSQQVVQVVDTGLDQRSCFFSDRRGNVLPTTYSAAKFDLTRRKVVQVCQLSRRDRPAGMALMAICIYQVPLPANFSHCPPVLSICVPVSLQYVVWADQSDVNSGHGTHVAGTSSNLHSIFLFSSPGMSRLQS